MQPRHLQCGSRWSCLLLIGINAYVKLGGRFLNSDGLSEGLLYSRLPTHWQWRSRQWSLSTETCTGETCWWRRLRESKCASSGSMVISSRCTLTSYSHTMMKLVVWSDIAGKDANNYPGYVYSGGIWGYTCHHHWLLPFPRWGGEQACISLDQQPDTTIVKNTRIFILIIKVEGQLIYNNLAEDPAVFQVSYIRKLPGQLPKDFSKIFLLRGGVLIREETTSLTSIGQWSSTIRSEALHPQDLML